MTVVAIVISSSSAVAAAAHHPRHDHGQRVSSHQRPSPPIDAEAARQPLRLYRVYVKKQLSRLQPQLQTLDDAITSADVDAAKTAWTAARRTYLTIGQDNDAYGAFGELGARIDGTAAGLKHGTADPKFTGFHKVELDLWRTGDLSMASNDAARLTKSVKTLADRPLQPMLPANKGSESDWILRSHEILEDAIRDSLSGNDDYGSGTTMSSVTADVRATRQILVLLTPLIVPRAPHLLGHADKRLHRLATLARGTKQDGAWVPLSALGRPQREAINAAAGAAAETLAPVPDLLRIGNT